jgi:hypothetical protein
MNYFFLKLGRGNDEASSLQRTRPTASIYFDGLSEEDYRKPHAGNSQARLFIQRGLDENRCDTVIVVIHEATVWILQPAGTVEFEKPFTKDGVSLTKKTMPVRVLAKVPSKLVPLVLAGIGCSQAHGRRTFTRIKHWGNLKAIDCVLEKHSKGADRRWVPGPTEPDEEIAEHWRRLAKDKGPNQTAAQLLECLGSTELETLVAKLFEEHGSHVPAHFGGMLKDIDIFASNDSSKAIRIGELRVPARSTVSIQVKSGGRPSYTSTVDYLIGLEVVPDPRAFGAEWLLARVKECPPVKRWLRRSLNWMPEHFLKQFGL